MNKIIKFLIGIWLAIGATGLVLGFINLFTKGIKDALYFFMITVVSVVMFFINRRRYNMYVKENPNTPKQ